MNRDFVRLNWHIQWIKNGLLRNPFENSRQATRPEGEASSLVRSPGHEKNLPCGTSCEDVPRPRENAAGIFTGVPFFGADLSWVSKKGGRGMGQSPKRWLRVQKVIPAEAKN